MLITYRRNIRRRVARGTHQLRELRTHSLWIAAGLILACAFSPFAFAGQNGAQTDSEAPTPLPAATPAPAQNAVMEADPSAHFLESGYRHLYELKFDDARADFAAYQKARPDDPLGKASEAASYLFEQFHQRGVLTSEFFTNDATFLGGVSGTAEENHHAGFVNATAAAREKAKALLKTDPNNIHGLLALTIADGMESDYDAIIIKKQLPGLSMMRQAEAEAKRQQAEADAQRKQAEADGQKKREEERLAALEVQRQEDRARIEQTCRREEAKLSDLKAAGAEARDQLVDVLRCLR